MVSAEGAAYASARLDRRAVERDAAGFIERMRAAPSARVLPMREGECFINGDGRPVWLEANALPAKASEVLVFLGCDQRKPRFAIDLCRLPASETDMLLVGATSTSVRKLAHRARHDELGVLAYAKGLLHWHAQQAHCGRCGGATRSAAAGHQRQCLDCGVILFPRIEPAVIVLVESAPTDEPRCLLVRHAKGGVFSTLAGFVEVGENLEEAVRREVEEETGVAIDAVRYVGSQAWPFPAGLMVAFRARAVLGPTSPDGIEVCEARWFTRKGVAALFYEEGAEGMETTSLNPDSIERTLIEQWLADGGVYQAKTT